MSAGFTSEELGKILSEVRTHEKAHEKIITEPMPKIYDRTSWLRWNERRKSILHDYEQVLQQAWCCRETGEIEWRDVEVVTQPLPKGKA